MKSERARNRKIQEREGRHAADEAAAVEAAAAGARRHEDELRGIVAERR